VPAVTAESRVTVPDTSVAPAAFFQLYEMTSWLSPWVVTVCTTVMPEPADTRMSSLATSSTNSAPLRVGDGLLPDALEAGGRALDQRHAPVFVGAGSMSVAVGLGDRHAGAEVALADQAQRQRPDLAAATLTNFMRYLVFSSVLSLLTSSNLLVVPPLVVNDAFIVRFRVDTLVALKLDWRTMACAWSLGGHGLT
jgi:hypothetical protein